MKPLIAVTCLAVLAAVGWYGYSEWREAHPPEPLWDFSKTLERMEMHENRAECARMISDWDAGDRGAIEREWGRFAEEQVDHCRFMVEVYDRQLEQE